MFRFGRGRTDLKIYFSRGWKCFHRDKYHRFRPTSNVPRYIRIVRLTVRKTDRTELFPRCDNTSRAFFHSNSLIRSFFLFFQIFSLSSLPRSMTWCNFFWSFVYFPVFFLFLNEFLSFFVFFDYPLSFPSLVILFLPFRLFSWLHPLFGLQCSFFLLFILFVTTFLSPQTFNPSLLALISSFSLSPLFSSTLPRLSIEPKSIFHLIIFFSFFFPFFFFFKYLLSSLISPRNILPAFLFLIRESIYSPYDRF